jgi:Ni2+-binding GTPase involved in maturation of urease and hydrogenase
MFQFNLNQGLKICKIRGGKYNNQYIYLSKKEDIKDDKTIKFSSLIMDSDNHFEICPSDAKNDMGKPQRTIIYVAGPSGSGKSTLISHFINNYVDLYPRNDIYLFSKVNNDSSIKSRKKINNVMIDERIITEPLESSDFKNSLCIMDDIDTLKDKKIKDKLVLLRDDIGETGRHDNCSLAITSHLIAKGKETAGIINEAQIVVIYLSSGCNYNYYLTQKLGLNTKQINKLKALSKNSRWTAIYRTHPQIILTEKRILFLSDLDDYILN